MAYKHQFENRRIRICMWLLNELQRKPQTREELNSKYRRMVELSAGEDIERRTFQNYRHMIEDVFHVSIECDKRNGYRYYVVEDGERNHVQDWILGNFRMEMTLGKCADLGNRVILEDIPKGLDELETIVESIRSKLVVHIEYKDFNYDKVFEYEAEPQCVKLYQQRWYVVVWCESFRDYEVLSLDRITNIELTDEHFEEDPDFDGHEFFRYSFGTRTFWEREPEVVCIKVCAGQVPYMRTLPLHHSQKEVETHPDYSVFEMLLVPTIELTMKLLSMGRLVEVLAPESLRETMAEEAAELYRVYKTSAQ